MSLVPSLIKPLLSLVLLAVVVVNSTQAQPFVRNVQQTAAGSSPQYVATADFNKDGILDFVVSQGQVGRALVFTSTKQGEYVETEELLFDQYVQDLVCLDVDFNGDVDIVTSSGQAGQVDGQLIVDLNQGDGTFKRAYKLPDIGSALDLKLIDMDADGVDEVLAACPGPDQHRLHVFKNDGAGQLSIDFSISCPGIPKHMVLQDYNQDGQTDISVMYADRAFVDLFLRTGASEFTISQSVAAVSGGNGHCSADFNNDGTPDIAIASASSSELLVYFQRGNGTFRPVESLRLGDLLQEVVTADFDLDGDYDLLVSEQNSGEIVTLINPGDGSFSVESDGETWSRVFKHRQPRGLTLLHLNQDEYLDFVVASLVDRNLNLYRNVAYQGAFRSRVFYNPDGDCVEKDGSLGMKDFLIELEPGPIFFVSSRGGNVRGNLEPGTYTARLATKPHWAAACESGEQELLMPLEGDARSPLLFPLQPKYPVQELEVSLASGHLRAGREFEYVIDYYNSGTLPYVGMLTLELDSRLEFLSATLTPATVDPGKLSWLLQDIPPSGAGRIIIKMQVPQTARQGEEFCARLEAEVKQSDKLLNDFTDELCVPVTGGFDPNDIRVWPRGEGAEGRITRDVSTLSYMVRFQNTGNDTTFTVVVRDTLPEELNVRRLRFGAASHEYSVDLLKNNILEFTFDDILLPDSTTDLLGSQGFVKFRIDLQEDLPVGTQVRNRVGIYFDFNDVVMTNTALTTISSGVTSVSESLNFESLSLYPNPASDKLTVAGIDAKAESLEVVDALGRRVLHVKLNSQTRANLRLDGLGSGSYFVQVRGGGLRNLGLQVERFEVME